MDDSNFVLFQFPTKLNMGMNELNGKLNIAVRYTIDVQAIDLKSWNGDGKIFLFYNFSFLYIKTRPYQFFIVILSYTKI